MTTTKRQRRKYRFANRALAELAQQTATSEAHRNYRAARALALGQIDGHVYAGPYRGALVNCHSHSGPILILRQSTDPGELVSIHCPYELQANCAEIRAAIVRSRLDNSGPLALCDLADSAVALANDLISAAAQTAGDN